MILICWQCHWKEVWVDDQAYVEVEKKMFLFKYFTNKSSLNKIVIINVVRIWMASNGGAAKMLHS